MKKSDGNKPVAKKLMIFNIVVASVVALYCFIIFTNAPLISEARDLWIETAMTTAEHQWLATRFFPRWLVDDVMSKQIITDESVLSNPDLFRIHKQDGKDDGAGDGAFHAPGVSGVAWGSEAVWASGDYDAVTDGTDERPADAGGDDDRDAGGADGGVPDDGQDYSNAPDAETGLSDGAADREAIAALGSRGWFLRAEEDETREDDAVAADLPPFADTSFPGMSFFRTPEFLAARPSAVSYLPAVGDVDENGNTVIISDKDEEVVAVEIRKSGYVGRILFVPDPARVVVKHTNNKNVQGDLIKSFLDRYNAIAGMNGNGFDDPDGHGRGGQIIGWSVSGGAAWGSGSKSEYASVGFNDQNILMVGTFKDFAAHNIRDLAQYGPTIIVDGKKLIKGSGGWGIQPRSAIGQRDDGVILMATFDGRQPGHSLGITAGEIADIFFSYGCVNAGLCDGGSSSIMMYGGEVVGKPSTPMKDTGRYLPNAFLVLSRNQPDETEMTADSL